MKNEVYLQWPGGLPGMASYYSMLACYAYYNDTIDEVASDIDSKTYSISVWPEDV